MTLNHFVFDIESEIINLSPANPASTANQSKSVSNFSDISQAAPIDPQELSHEDLAYVFQERAAIREFEGNQSRIESELDALDEVLPYLKNGNELIVSTRVSPKYQWWAGGQSLKQTLRELGACEETIKCYVGDKRNGILKPVGND
ncbi:MAG: hypothetical protein IPJ69_00835 [Deltaproteobacteria bacterium]|nr:MAG: hypothetical protein IPJ69_00835 [Deltaproteobacteria bacterium]